jgi:organic hydroperoxide reductase OsmC/OhrA
MMGTLARFLAKSKIDTSEDRYRAKVEGDIENLGGVLKITRIRVDYSLRTPPGKKEAAEQALAAYLPSCPAAQSVIGCIEISHRLALEEE